MSADVLTFTVVLPSGKYPSTNQEGKDNRRNGAKSDAYKWLFEAVKSAAKREIERVSWETATCECFCLISLVVPQRGPRDALNIGKAEGNALTVAGVWQDDTLAEPVLKWIRYDPDGPYRVHVVVVKLHRALHDVLGPPKRRASADTKSKLSASKTAEKARSLPVAARVPSSGTIGRGERRILVNGKPDADADVHDLLRRMR